MRQQWGTPTRVLAVLLVSVLAALGACSDEDPPRSTSTLPRSEQFTVLDLLGRDGQFIPFREVVTAGQQDALLSGAGPVTLIAPDRTAVTPELVASLSADPAAAAAFVRRHTLEGRYPYQDLLRLGGSTVRTVDGRELPVTVEGTTVTVGGATLRKFDIGAANGVIHVTDGTVPAA